MLISVRDNLILRSLSKSDASQVYSVIDSNRAYLRTWLPWVDGTSSPTVTESVITSWEKALAEGRDIVLGIFESGEYIGNMGLHDINRHNRSAMVGYWLAKGSQGRGIMTGCVRALMDLGFSTLALNRIYIHCAAENTKSRAIPERLGFVQEGMLQDGECLYGVFHDLIVYGMVSRNWQRSDVFSLIAPALEHKEKALDYRQEHIDCGERIHGSWGFQNERYQDYELWLGEVNNLRLTPMPTINVPANTFFAFVDDKIVGTIQVRHSLNDYLLSTGGHIGYGIRPSERRKGYATKMLALALEKCRELGIDKALVTCDKDNAASAKTAIKCGGVLENEFIEENGNVVQRYWIAL